MNRVLIYAGGKGTRMKISPEIPKQFMKINDKCIIIYTIEKFENCSAVDDIVVVCLDGWITYLEQAIKDAGIKKVSKIISGGLTGFDSRLNGLEYFNQTKSADDDIILIHDGVRPFITNDIIEENINCAKIHGVAITITPLTETLLYTGSDTDKILNRDNCFLARAPQTFKLSLIYDLYKRAYKDNKTDIIDSASIAYHYGETLHYVVGPQENIKITTPIDYFSASGIINSMDEY